jgi:hypothetical protein
LKGHRFLLLITALCAVACSNAPTREQQAVIADVESKVSLPPGGGKLSCYARHYTILQGQELVDWGLNKPGRKLLMGYYLPSNKPGVFWHEKSQHLPKMADAGCDMLEVLHLIGEREQRISAFCSANIAGYQPETVDPPRNC